MTTWQELLEFQQRHTPSIVAAWAHPRYVAPAGREALYPNWDKVAACEVGAASSAPVMFAQGNLRHPGAAPREIRSEEASAMLHYKMRRGCPTIYLEPELARALMETETPEDIPCQEIHWAFETLRLVLPKGFLKNPEGQDILTINGGVLHTKERIGCPAEYGGSLAWTPMTQICDSEMMIWDMFADDPNIVCLHGYRPWNDKTLREVHAMARKDDGINAEEAHIVERACRVLLNTILVLQARPDYLSAGSVRRKGNPARGVSELREGRTLGSFLKKHKPGSDHTPHGGHAEPQVRKGHWRMQPHGPKHSLRKLMWIHPYFTGA